MKDMTNIIKRVNIPFTPNESEQVDSFIASNYIKFAPWLKSLILREIGVNNNPVNYINRRQQNVQQKQNKQS